MGLLSFLFGSKPQMQQNPNQPKGLLAPAAPAVNQNAYRDYVIDMQSQGKAPLPYADWAKSQQPQQK